MTDWEVTSKITVLGALDHVDAAVHAAGDQRGTYDVFPVGGGPGVRCVLGADGWQDIHLEEVPAPAPPRIEILTVRHPDSSTEVTLFVDGVPVTDYTEESVDPGYGHQIDDWFQSQVDLVASPYCSEAFKAAALAAYADYDESSYLEGERSEAVITCHHATGSFTDGTRKYCPWEYPFDTVEAAAAALKEHQSTHPEK